MKWEKPRKGPKSNAGPARESAAGTASGLAGGMLWALDSVILSFALAPFDLALLAPVCATMIHDSFSALLLLIIDLFKRKGNRLMAALKQKESRWLILAGLLGGPVGMSGYVFSISCLGPGLAAVLSCLYPAFGLLLARLFLHERFGARQIFGMVLSLAGAGLLSCGGSGPAGSHQFLGLLCGLVCALGWALEGIAAQKGTAAGIGSVQALTIRQCVSALTFMIAILPLSGSWPLALKMIRSSSLIQIACAALAGTLSYLCYYRAIRLIGAARAMPLNITYCAWAVVFSFLMTGIAPSMMEVLCSLAVVAGAVLCAQKSGEPVG